MSDLHYGEVVFFNPKTGYGFIKWEKSSVPQKDIFIHYSDIQATGFKTLYKGQKVSFKLGINHHGVIKAIEVMVLQN